MSAGQSFIVFDIDGTLTDSVRPHQKALEAALRSFGFPALRTDWGSYKHHSDSAIFVEAWEEAQFRGAPDLGLLEQRYAAAYDHFVREDPVQEILGAGDFIRSLDGHWNVVFATGSLRHGARRKLEVVGVDCDNVVLTTASEFFTREEIVSQALERGKSRYGVTSPERIVSIGDGLWDFKTAGALGYEFIGIGEGEKAEYLRSLGANVISNFRQTADLGISECGLPSS